MSVSVRLLLPVENLESLELFEGLPAAALLLPGNVPALAPGSAFCLLAPGHVIERFNSAERFKAFAAHIGLQVVPIDDLVLDQPFDAVPAMAYMKAIAQAGPAGKAFVFLQPNLVLADGALRHVAERLTAGAQVLTATYLRADPEKMQHRLATEGGAALAPRALVHHAIKCMDVRDHANIVNAEQPLTGPAGRFFWRHGNFTLVARDFMTSLVAIRPSIRGGDVRGFRDTAFISSLCQDATIDHFDDSDHFLGVELCRPAPEASLSIWRGSPKQTAEELSVWTNDAQRASAVRHYAVFHDAEVLPSLLQVVAESSAYVEAVVEAMGPARPVLDHPRWQLARYLWGVRRFELGRGAMPDSFFERLFAHLPTVVELQAGPPQADRSSPPLKILRMLRGLVLGRAPLVTILHPNWIDFRAAMPALRAAQRMERGSVLYVGDGAALLARVLGSPAFVSAHLLERTYDVDRSGLRLAVLELSSASLENWSALVGKIIPKMAPGAQIVIFHRNDGSATATSLKRTLALGTMELSTHQVKRFDVAIAGGTAYQDWLRHGYEVAVGLGRTRRPAGMLKGGLLLALVATLNMVSNIAGALTPGREHFGEAWASVTIVVTP